MYLSLANTKGDEKYNGSHHCPAVYWMSNVWHYRSRNGTGAKVCGGQWRRVWRCLSITLLSSCEWAALPGTQETVLGNPGFSRERKEAVVSVTRENNSLVCSAQNEGIVRKHREPSITLCTLSKVFSFTQKGKDRKGFAVLLKSCSPHYTTSPAVVGPLSSNSLTVAGAVGKVQALMVSESVYGSSFLSSPPLGGLPHPWAHWSWVGRENQACCAVRKTEKQSWNSASHGHLSKVVCSSPCSPDHDPSQSPTTPPPPHTPTPTNGSHGDCPGTKPRESLSSWPQGTHWV